MQVEDHPLEYGGFEGIIPEGEYGGGTVMLWDQGAWEPIGDPAKGFREGHLKFILHGEKLQGGWMLVRKGGRKAEQDERALVLVQGARRIRPAGGIDHGGNAAQRHDRPGSGRDRGAIGPRLGTGRRGPQETVARQPASLQTAAADPAEARAKPAAGGVATSRASGSQGDRKAKRA